MEETKEINTPKKRTFRKHITAKACKENNLKPLDVFKMIGISAELEEQINSLPIDLTWDNMINFTNLMIESGEILTLNDDILEISKAYTEALQEGFL